MKIELKGKLIFKMKMSSSGWYFLNFKIILFKINLNQEHIRLNKHLLIKYLWLLIELKSPDFDTNLIPT